MKKILFIFALLAVIALAQDTDAAATTDADAEAEALATTEAETQTTVSEDGTTTTTTVVTQTIIIEEVIVEEIVYSPPCPVHIVNVHWGLTDVTETARDKYDAAQREFAATNAEWGLDGWPTYEKSLVVLYDVCENYSTVVAKEGESVTLP
mmetsp:Transcript_28720/g.27700  ORF Transcript_28720/g.27700 Transcript_28720/m.27700 type:complete len:151 (-) Transcript_28720:41-493(-)